MNSKNLAVLIREQFQHFAPNEKKVARVLLNNYPIAGLETIAQLAQKASVSGPTVLRLINKLGFDGYGQFQETLRRELETQLNTSTHTQLEVPNHENFPLTQFLHMAKTHLEETVHNIIPEDFDATVQMMTDKRAKIFLIGNCLIYSLVEYFYQQLHAIRSDVELLHPCCDTWMNTLADIRKQDIIVVFDTHPYSDNLKALLQVASEKKCKIVLISDQSVSSLSGMATLTLPIYRENHQQENSHISIIFMIEALITTMKQTDSEHIHERLTKIETLRTQYES